MQIRFDRAVAIRFDRSALARSRRNIVDGSLTIEGHAARVHRPGDGLAYPTASGAVRYEHRDLDEVRSIVQQLPGAKVTLQHPRGMVREGAPAHIAGRVDSARLDGEHAAATMTLHDRAAIDAVTSGRAEYLSLGYECHTDDAGYQRNIKVDHLAIVEAARCGETCAINTDRIDRLEGVTMDPQLEQALKLVNVRTDGLSQRDIALAVLTACGTNVDGPCASDNPTPLKSRDDTYVIARAYYTAQGHVDTAARRDAAASFATAPVVVQRTDCGCGGKGHAPHVDGFAVARAARDRMIHRNRLAYAAGTDRADEVEAIEAIRDRMAPIVRPPARRDGVRKSEAETRAAMHADSRNAHAQSNGLAEAIRAGQFDTSRG